MNVITEGHLYALENFEGEDYQKLQFIQKVPKETNSSELVTIQNGTTNEEVLKCLINRLQFLQAKTPCRENAIVITKLEESLMWLEKRTHDRKLRGVEGTGAK